MDEPGPGDHGDRVRLVAEVQQHIGRNQVRAVAMSSTDGLVRGMAARDTGGPISVPVGMYALGRILNVLGEPVDFAGSTAARVKALVVRLAGPRLPAPPR